MIEVTHLSKSYNSLVAVDDISFTVEQGTTFGLLGPNGAGKTTTINMLVGALRPDAGTIAINGDTDPTRTHVRYRIGNAPQSLAIYEELTGEENLRFFGSLYKLRGARLKERIDWAFEFTGLTERRKQLVKKYSGGMKRRLNMVCALLHDPAVLLLDEPTVGVDPQSRNQIFEGIEALKKEGRTIIYTTHYMEEAQRLCDKVAIIDHGKILALDTVDALISQYGGVSLVEGELTTPPPPSVDIPGKLDGLHLRVETEHPLETLAQVVQSGCQFQTLKVQRADLEAVFLNLTGRRLRD